MAYSTANMLGANLTMVYTPSTDLVPFTGGDSPPFAVGQMTVGTDGSEWTFVLATANIAQYDWVGVDEDYDAAPLTKAMADDGWIIGVAQVAIASGSYGWVCTKGANVSGNVAASTAADSALYTSSVAGTLKYTGSLTLQTKIDGVVAVTAKNTVAGATEVLLTWPRSSTF
jgi:hypothetical protein